MGDTKEGHIFHGGGPLDPRRTAPGFNPRYIFVPSPSIGVTEALCFRVLCPCVLPCVRPDVISVSVIPCKSMNGISRNFR